MTEDKAPALLSKADRLTEPETGLETQRRQQLMKATMECVAEIGVEKTTVWMVAERAGVSTGMVLYYYRNKRELINSAVSWAAREFSSRLNTVTEGNYGPERLKESIRIFLHDPSGAIPANFLIQYRMAALNDPEIRQQSLKVYEHSRQSLAKSVRAAQEHSQIRPDVQDYSLADLIYTLANGLAAEMAAHPEIMSLERAAEIAQLALDSFAADGSQAFDIRDIDVAQSEGRRPSPASESTPDLVERALMADGKLSLRSARTLADAFRNLYEIAAGESPGNLSPNQ
ncbi:MAG TPA: TetR/AcrR family transcriptional regulator [Dehalococcoidia bacterium]|nr:TetR/AcrR family transcriptional regulator [Dehalococcoidia bacterium]